MRSIVIASPYRRNDALEQYVRRSLPEHEVFRYRTKEELTAAALAAISPVSVFFPHWSWRVPEDIYSRFDCVMFHMTDLPYGRGGSPLQNLIVRGHRETVVTALRCARDIDAGPIYLKRPLSLAGTAEEILTRASAVMGSMIVDLVKRRPTPVAQHGDVVEFKRRQPDDGDLSSLGELAQVYDFIRMLDAEGYPPAFLDTARLHLEFSEARMGDEVVEAKVRFRKKGE